MGSADSVEGAAPAVENGEVVARPLDGAAAIGEMIAFRLPPQYAVLGKLLESPIVQLHAEGRLVAASRHPYVQNGVAGAELRAGGERFLVFDRQVRLAAAVVNALRCKRGDLDRVHTEDVQASLRWVRPTPLGLDEEDVAEAALRRNRVIQSWRGAFRFVEEQGDPIAGGARGLRSPQLGAIHAALGHWRASDEPATIVMPTGTGKTETMLALLVEQAMDRVLVVVPTHALREQIAGKFVTLGKLRELGAIAPTALYPVVGRLEKIPPSVQDAKRVFERCNVVVTTMQIMGQCRGDVLEAVAGMCSHLFIDEAHHIVAPTWSSVRRAFGAKRIVQFTATPFRTDGQLVEGKVIFNFPLRRAQEQGYFAPITFKPVTEFFQSDGDRSIAKAAVAQLDADLAAGHDHLVMARTASMKRAAEVANHYAQVGAAHKPVLIHSDLAPADQTEALSAIRSRQSRIVVCVNMLGEGFDLPNLKIAALHDIHKSLAITLQFAGRFTRAVQGLGGATMIANLGDADVEGALFDLYAEDSDWNVVLRRLSEGATTDQVRRSEFLSGFADPPAQVPLQNVLPKMSAVVYRTRCAAWAPQQLRAAIDDKVLLVPPVVNPRERVAVAVRRFSQPVSWGNVKDLRDVFHDLIVLYWDQARGLLFINTSDNSTSHKPLAEAVCGRDVALVNGEQVFRVFSGVTRLILMNLGLGHTIGKAVRYTMYVGNDVLEGLATAAMRNKHKSNLFARGYELGDRATYGCSHRGRVWSHKVANDIGDWKRWCDAVGTKLLDDSISVDQIVQGALRFAAITSRPMGYPIGVDWPEELFSRSEEAVWFEVAGMRVSLLDTVLEIADPSPDGPIRLRLRTPQWQVVYELDFGAEGTTYRFLGAVGASIQFGRVSKPVADWFDEEPPVIRFGDGGFLISNQYSAAPPDIPPYDPTLIQTIDWTGIDLGRESQTAARLADSIQYRLIETITGTTWPYQYDIVFDDDTAYEAADVIAIKVDGEKLIVHLFHCKFSSEAKPGGRVADLYEICGQAQRCVVWRGEDPVALFDHIRHREGLRVARGEPTRFERGSMQAVRDIRRRARQLAPEFRVFAVQPGLSKSGVSAGQLELLGTTELYLRETFGIPLTVLASD